MIAVKDSFGIQSIIAKRMGIARSTLCEWLDRNPEYWKYIEEENIKRIDLAESTITQDLKNIETAKWFMTKYKGGRARGFSDKETQVNVQNNTIEQTKIIIEVVDATNKTPTDEKTTFSIPISD